MKIDLKSRNAKNNQISIIEIRLWLRQNKKIQGVKLTA